MYDSNKSALIPATSTLSPEEIDDFNYSKLKILEEFYKDTLLKTKEWDIHTLKILCITI